MDFAAFLKKPLLGIVRGIAQKDLDLLLEAAIAGGLETIEITMNTANACDLIRRAVKRHGKYLTVGAGTVLNRTDLGNALRAGATFVVSPVIVPPVIDYCVRRKIPVFPGALSPQDIYQAWRAGASMVKVFPAHYFGPDYFRELKGPFAEIKLMACGGITPRNAEVYFTNGASAVAVGSSVFRKEWVGAKKFRKIQNKIRTYLKILP